MSERVHERDLTKLLQDCFDVMTDPCPATEHWVPYCHLLYFKLNNSMPPSTRHLVDDVLTRMREQLEAHSRSSLARWQMMRRGELPDIRLRKEEPLHAALSDFLISSGGSDFLYHGTVRGRLAPIHMRGLCPELRPCWPNRGPESFELVSNWREAEVHAVMAHLRCPRGRILPYWMPVVLRVSVDTRYFDQGFMRVATGCAVVRGAVPAANADVWLVGDREPWPHWQPLPACLTRRMAS